MSELITCTEAGLFCAAGGFYIDPWKQVDRAVITHAHSDHARSGHKAYLCHHATRPLLQARLGDHHFTGVRWNEPVFMNGVRVSLHPAGHIIGSSQVRVEYKGEVWVASGDYKTTDDGISGAFEPVQCHAFITESTFGLPVYRWQPQEVVYGNIRNWVVQNKAKGICSVLIAYSLGKAQRLLTALEPLGEPILVHGAIYAMHKAVLETGIALPPVELVTPGHTRNMLRGRVVIAPPGADGSPWLKRFEPCATGICSGWMQVRGNARRRNADAGFVLSDHADWDGLLEAVHATGAGLVYTTHGFQSVFSRYLNEQGIESKEVQTAFGGEDSEEPETPSNSNP